MRTSTWTNIGTDLNTTSINTALADAGLDYTVEKQPIYLADGTVVKDKVATVISGTSEVFGIVSPKYEICQNETAFDFINNISDIKLIKAGQTASGMVYVIGKLPSTTVLGDTFTPYLIFQNGHNGNYTLKTTICPLRMVCQNQFNYAFRESPNTISIQHSRQYPVKLAEAERLIASTVQYMTNFNDTAEELAMLKIGNDAKVKDIINAFFKVTENATDRQIITAETKRDELFTAYQAEDNQNFKGTAWGLINGFSDYITHKESTRQSDDNKFISVTLDPRLFMAFVNHVKQFA